MERQQTQRTNTRPRQAKSPKKRKANYWRIGMAVYVVLFLLIGGIVLRRLWVYLGEFEASRPQYTMESYMQTVNMDYFHRMLQSSEQTFSMTPFETKAQISAALEAQCPTDAKFSYIKKGDEYTDETPVYLIRANEMTIAAVHLTAVGTTDSFSFPVWAVGNPIPMITVSAHPDYTVEISLPQEAVLNVNGQSVDDSFLVETIKQPELSAQALAYTTQPTTAKYRISGLYHSPTISATAADGTALQTVEAPADASSKQQNYIFSRAGAETLTTDCTDRMKSLCKAYIDYMVNKNLATANNLAALDKFLVFKSDAYRALHSMSGSVSWNNPYTAREDNVLTVEKFQPYTDTCFSCETHFEVVLTKNAVTNHYDGTVRWTMVKTETGWRAAQMELL